MSEDIFTWDLFPGIVYKFEIYRDGRGKEGGGGGRGPEWYQSPPALRCLCSLLLSQHCQLPSQSQRCKLQSLYMSQCQMFPSLHREHYVREQQNATIQEWHRIWHIQTVRFTFWYTYQLEVFTRSKPAWTVLPQR